MGHNHIQVGALFSGIRMATSPMPNTGPISTPHQSAMPLSRLPSTTLCTTKPDNHYLNYNVADHEVPQELQEHQIHPISRLIHEKLIP